MADGDLEISVAADTTKFDSGVADAKAAITDLVETANATPVELKANTSVFQTEIKKAETVFGEFENKVEKDAGSIKEAIEKIESAGKSLNRVFGEMIEAYAGGQIIEFFKTFVEAAGDTQARVINLNQAILAMGTASSSAGEHVGEIGDHLQTVGEKANETGEQVLKFSENLAKASGNALPQVIQGMTKFIGIGASVAQSEYLGTLAANISARAHVGLAEAQQLLTRSIETGSLAAFARLGIGIKGVNLRTVDLDVGIKKMGEQMSGAATAAAAGLEGSLARLRVEMEAIKDKFGSDFLKPITAIVNEFIYLGEVFEAMSPQARQLIEVVALLVGGFIALSLILPLLITITESYGKVIDAVGYGMEKTAIAIGKMTEAFAALDIAELANPLVLLGVALVAIVAIIAIAAVRSKDFRDTLVGAFENCVRSVEAFGAGVLRVMQAVVTYFTPLIKAIGFIAALSIGLDIITVQAVGHLVAFVVQAYTGMVKAVIAQFTPLVEAWINLDKAILEVVGHIVQWVSEQFGGLFKFVGDGISNIIRWLGGLVQQIPGVHDALAKGTNVLNTVGAAGSAAYAKVVAGAEAAGKAAGKAGEELAKYVKQVTTMGKIEVPKMPAPPDPGNFDALGGGKKKKEGKGEEGNILGNLKQEIADQLDPYKIALDQITEHLDLLKAAEDRVKAGIGESGESLRQFSELLDDNAKEAALARQQQQTYTAEMTAQGKAVGELNAERLRIAGNPKLQGDERQLIALIREHKDAIEKLAVSVAQAATREAEIYARRAKMETDYANQTLKAYEARIAADKALVDAQIANLDRLAAAQRADRTNAEARQASSFAVDQSKPDNINSWSNATDTLAQPTQNLTVATASAADAAKDAATAATTVGLRSLTAAADATRLALAQAAGGLYGGPEMDKLAKAALDSSNALDDATQKQKAADNAVVIATDKVTIAQNELQRQIALLNQSAFVQLRGALLSAVPQLQSFINILKTSTSPMQALANIFVQIFEQTQSFKDIITIVSNIFVVLARILDAIFLPIIRVVARVLTDVVNIFIFLYNVVADLVGIFGIHITRLKYINSLLDNMSGSATGLLTEVHSMPTAKEYGAGSWGTLTNGAGVVGGLMGAINNNTTGLNNNTLSIGKVLVDIVLLIAAIWAFITIMAAIKSGATTGVGGLINGLLGHHGGGVLDPTSPYYDPTLAPGGAAQTNPGPIGTPDVPPGIGGGSANTGYQNLTYNIPTSGNPYDFSQNGQAANVSGGGAAPLGGSDTSTPPVDTSTPPPTDSASATMRRTTDATATAASTAQSAISSAYGDANSALGVIGGLKAGGIGGSLSAATGALHLLNAANPGGAAGLSGISKSLGAAGAALGVVGGLKQGGLPGDLQAGSSAVKFAQTLLPRGDAIQMTLGTAAKAFGGALGGLGIFEGFKQGGISGGIEAGFGAAGLISALMPAGVALGPLGIAAAAAIGLAAMLLGGHKDRPADMADKYDTKRFTQLVGELQGSAGTAYGPAYNPATDPVQKALGGMPMLHAIQQWIAQNEASTNPAIRKLALQLKPIWGNTPGGLNFAKIIGNESVKGGSESGTYVSIWNDANSAIKSISNVLSAAQNVTSGAAAAASYGSNPPAPAPAAPAAARFATSNITQNNTIGTVSSSAAAVALDNALGHRLQIIARTQRYAG